MEGAAGQGRGGDNGARPPAGDHPTFSEILVGLGEGSDPKLYVGEVMDAFDQRALGAVMLIWSLINFLPLPPGGTTITGAPLLILSMELALGRDSLWLPNAMLRRSIPRSTFRKGFGWLVPMIRLAERLSRPRLTWLTGPFGQVLIGLTCFLLSVILVLPIPLGNIAPAITMAFFSLGVMQRDGVAVLLGWLSAAISFGLLALAWKVVWGAVGHLVERAADLPVPIP